LTVGHNGGVDTELEMVAVDEFQAAAAAWIAANKEIAPPDYGAILPPRLRDAGVAWQRHLLAEGWAGIHWPTEHGGRGLTAAHQAAWLEECARAQVPPFINMVGFVLAGQALLRFGSPGQQAEHLRPILTADRIWCQLFSEPGAGSDLGSLSTRAERDGDVFVVNGQKVWCSAASISDWGILMARTDPDVAKHRGISFFVIDMRSAGIETRPLRQMTGEAEFEEVFFTDVRLPAENLLGPLNEGWRVGMETLTNERGSIGAALIALRRRVDNLISLGGELEPTARQELASLVSRARAMEAMGQRQGPAASVRSSLNKLGATEMMFDEAVLRAGLIGPEAMLDVPATHRLLAAPGGRIAGGSSQIQRNIIGERILGLPKGPT
jgi:alkylation response protein AidB-like acyl-CoA dehydrogenase